MNMIHSTLTIGILAHRSLVQRSPTLVGPDLALFSGGGRIRREIGSAVLSGSGEKEGSQEDETRSARHDEVEKKCGSKMVRRRQHRQRPLQSSALEQTQCYEPNTRTFLKMDRQMPDHCQM